MAPETRIDRVAFRAGLRAAVPFAIAGFLVAVSFGVVAQDAGFSEVAAIVMSAVVFAGSAQFAAVAIVATGGAAGAAIVAAALVNARFLPMGVALGPSLPGGPLKRAVQGQAVVDASWAMAAQGDGSFDRSYLFGATSIQYVTWLGGTIAGALGGGLIPNPEEIGLDAVFPAFFLALLIAEVKDGRTFGVAALGAAIALVLVPVAPPGIPVLVSSVAALVGLWREAGDVSTVTVVILGCAIVTAAIKATGPVLSGGRDLPPVVRDVLVLFAPALLAALVVVSALAEGKHITVDAETAGVAVSGVVYWRTQSIVWCVLVAAAVTAGMRAL